jgi:hypothetical protein
MFYSRISFSCRGTFRMQMTYGTSESDWNFSFCKWDSSALNIFMQDSIIVSCLWNMMTPSESVVLQVYGPSVFFRGQYLTRLHRLRGGGAGGHGEGILAASFMCVPPAAGRQQFLQRSIKG